MYAHVSGRIYACDEMDSRIIVSTVSLALAEAAGILEDSKDLSFSLEILGTMEKCGLRVGRRWGSADEMVVGRKPVDSAFFPEGSIYGPMKTR